MLESFLDALTDIPGTNNATTHVIKVSANTPIKVQQYILPLHCEDVIKKGLI